MECITCSRDNRRRKMTITAKFRGTCKACGGEIHAGDKIEWEKGEGSRHSKCPDASAPTTPAKRKTTDRTPVDKSPAPIHLSGGSGYGDAGWEVGQVILAGEKRRRAGGPDGLVVVRASRRYIREDGMSFDVGDEQGYLYSADCRPATAEELRAAIDDRAHSEALAVERKLEIDRLEHGFAAGEHPEGEQFILAGEQVMVSSRARMHGSGTWAVIEPVGAIRYIWWVRNNGADGDDWRGNNVRTGGVGARGRRLPWAAELDRRVRSVAEPE
jgi:hypothetical protein